MEKNIKLLLAKRIRQLRKKYGYTQQELSEKTGIDYKHLQRLESNNPPAIRIDTLEKIAKVFNTSCSDLLNFNRR